MVAVLIWSHTAGGSAASAIASPTTRADSTRELIISARFFFV